MVKESLSHSLTLTRVDRDVGRKTLRTALSVIHASLADGAIDEGLSVCSSTASLRKDSPEQAISSDVTSRNSGNRDDDG